jgi:hypothetical protein
MVCMYLYLMGAFSSFCHTYAIISCTLDITIPVPVSIHDRLEQRGAVLGARRSSGQGISKYRSSLWEDLNNEAQHSWRRRSSGPETAKCGCISLGRSMIVSHSTYGPLLSPASTLSEEVHQWCSQHFDATISTHESSCALRTY